MGRITSGRRLCTAFGRPVRVVLLAWISDQQPTNLDLDSMPNETQGKQIFLVFQRIYVFASSSAEGLSESSIPTEQLRKARLCGSRGGSCRDVIVGD